MMRSLYGHVLDIAVGLAPAPAPDGAPAPLRWRWFGDLYADPTWGIAANVNEFPESIAATMRIACRATNSASDTALLSEEWRLLAHLAHTRLLHAHGDAETHAWTTITFSALDADDHLHGRTFGGTEQITSAFLAILAAQPPSIAHHRIQAAHQAWTAMNTNWKAVA